MWYMVVRKPRARVMSTSAMRHMVAHKPCASVETTLFGRAESVWDALSAVSLFEPFSRLLRAQLSACSSRACSQSWSVLAWSPSESTSFLGRGSGPSGPVRFSCVRGPVFGTIRTVNADNDMRPEALLAWFVAPPPPLPPPLPTPAPLSRLRPRKTITYKPTVVRAKKKGSSKTPSRAEEKRKYRQEQKKKKEQKKQANAAKLKAWVGKNDGVELYLQDVGYYQGYVATAWKSTSRRRVAGVEVDARLTTKPCKS